MRSVSGVMVSAPPSRRRFLAGALAAGFVLGSGRATAEAAEAQASWQVYDVPRSSTSNRERIVGIYAASPSDAWAVGYWREVGPLLSRWNGSGWSPVSTRLSSGSIAGAGADDVWIGGDYGRTHHWDGSAWTGFSLPGVQDFYYEGLGQIAAGAPGRAWAYGLLVSSIGNGAVQFTLSQWNGAGWRLLPYPVPAQEFVLADLSGMGSRLWVAGVPGSPVMEWDGARWVNHPLPADAGLTVRADHIAAVAPSEVWVSGAQVTGGGSTRAAYLARWNGSAWTRVAIPGGDGVPALFDTGGGLLLRTSQNTLFRWASGAWQALPASPFPNAGFYAGAPGGAIWTGGGRADGSRTIASTALYDS